MVIESFLYFLKIRLGLSFFLISRLENSLIFAEFNFAKFSSFPSKVSDNNVVFWSNWIEYVIRTVTGLLVFFLIYQKLAFR